ncbi:hypothetical protein Dsin_018981 [Dipteronia sinensis]|uniref:Uncharacterized protein n=1 Tax=Dipteronia sinensis TaxID=43782 RepID=A0AAE0A6L1_9ROSI|nr:hypothetical protein Dsin_018981 [Dipteronia sinensis]
MLKSMGQTQRQSRLLTTSENVDELLEAPRNYDILEFLLILKIHKAEQYFIWLQLMDILELWNILSTEEWMLMLQTRRRIHLFIGLALNSVLCMRSKKS